jgi:Cu2+-exporting ATPase
MSCCAPGAEYTLQTSDPATAREEVRLASHVVGDGLRQTDLSVPGVHCGGCIRTVETALAQLPGVVQARVNLSTRRVTIRWRDDAPPAPFIATLNAVGYDAHLFEAGLQTRDDTQAELVRALAVAGFGASNIMLLSV